MGVHFCPIEPDDWSNGNGDEYGDCRECEGTGTIENDMGDELTCSECGGSGFMEPPDLSDFDD